MRPSRPVLQCEPIGSEETNRLQAQVIAHRITTLKNCDQIIELANGEIRALGGHEQMMRRAAKMPSVSSALM